MQIPYFPYLQFLYSHCGIKIVPTSCLNEIINILAILASDTSTQCLRVLILHMAWLTSKSKPLQFIFPFPTSHYSIPILLCVSNSSPWCPALGQLFHVFPSFTPLSPCLSSNLSLWQEHHLSYDLLKSATGPGADGDQHSCASLTGLLHSYTSFPLPPLKDMYDHLPSLPLAVNWTWSILHIPWRLSHSLIASPFTSVPGISLDNFTPECTCKVVLSSTPSEVSSQPLFLQVRGHAKWHHRNAINKTQKLGNFRTIVLVSPKNKLQRKNTGDEGDDKKHRLKVKGNKQMQCVNFFGSSFKQINYQKNKKQPLKKHIEIWTLTGYLVILRI